MYKTKEIAIAELIKNPAYDSDWVNIAADLLSSTHIDRSGFDLEFEEESLATLSAKQLSIVSDAVQVNKNIHESTNEKYAFVPINKMIYYGLNATQMEIIKTSYAKMAEGKCWPEEMHKLLYSMVDEAIPYVKLNYLCMGIVEEFYDIVKYKHFEPAQIAEIYSGWKDGVPYETYAKESIDGDCMSIIRHILVLCKENKFTYNFD